MELKLKSGYPPHITGGAVSSSGAVVVVATHSKSGAGIEGQRDARGRIEGGFTDPGCGCGEVQHGRHGDAPSR